MLISVQFVAVAGTKAVVDDSPNAPTSVASDHPADAERQAQILAGDNLRLQQRALRRLGEISGVAADRILAKQLDELDAGRLPLGLWLDLLEAAGKRADLAIKTRLAEREKLFAASPDKLKAWRQCLEGGDPSEGRTIFRERVEAGCIRCHHIGNEGGAIGPDLTSLYQRAERIAILEAIIDPNSSIVPGFKNVLLKLKNGEEVPGILAFEGTDTLRVVSTTDGRSRSVAVVEIESEAGLPSPMPPGLGLILGQRAIRDLVEFLATPPG